ncbi:hypothetical protein P691DRAFT_847615 [Macrolepiota fuliginosa MF-IS2]|uniref:Uncharacterized protein n=1 Tax=Macrolepiota fuliginosa MF-IS2 TaxID=1400762 RepID=A0A9P6BYG0_9AGAR|nr:hypothetical protein P691DRAFT_847615 [Macrolepiota fuliginosa MF-IS2]
MAERSTAKESDTYSALQRTSSIMKDPLRLVPEPVMVIIRLNGQECQMLIDTGSLSDFVSSMLVDQLRLKQEKLTTPLGLQMAILEYQNIRENQKFDVINLLGCNLYQYSVLIGFNPAWVVIGSDLSLQIRMGTGVKKLASHSTRLYENNIEEVRTHLQRYAQPLCQTAENVPFPPLRDINHKIHLIDLKKTYHWRPLRCPEVLLPQWVEKWNAYLKTGQWEITNTTNTVLMLSIPKPGN